MEEKDGEKENNETIEEENKEEVEVVINVDLDKG